MHGKALDLSGRETQMILKKHFRVKLLVALVVYCICLISYPVCAQAKTRAYYVTLYDENNKQIKKIDCAENTYFTVPSIPDKKGYTFLGWATSSSSSKASYLSGKRLKVKSDIRLYARYFDRSKEKERAWGSLPRLNTKKYSKIIFVGDSRTERAGLRFKKDPSTVGMDEVVFLGKGGTTVAWCKSTAYKQIKKILAKTPKNKKVAIVFNHGVNSFSYKKTPVINTMEIIKTYASYYNSIAKSLKKENCELFYMSINPTNTAEGTGKNRDNVSIYTFNSYMQKYLAKDYTWINCARYLTNVGYAFDSGISQKSNIVDGTHYTTATYQRIYRYCMLQVNKK